jgi:hypothetical protein
LERGVEILLRKKGAGEGDKLEEARRLVEAGYRPSLNRRRGLIVFKRGNETRSIGLAFQPELYEELLRLYRGLGGRGAGAGAELKAAGGELIARAIRELRTPARPLERERIDRLHEYEALVTMLGRSCLEIYSDVSVDPAQLVGKGPEERARIKASKIIEQMKWEHGLRMSKPKTAEEAEREEVYEKLAGMQGSAVDDLRGLERRFYYLAYGRLFIEALERAIPTARAPQLRERILEELEKLENDERYVERLFKWAKLRSGLEAYLAFDRKMRSLLLKARTRPPGEVLEEAEEARAEYERAKLEASTQPVDFEEPL